MTRVLVLALAACGAAVPPVPGRGGPAWTELTSEHFTLWTDASASRGRELIRELEHLRQIEYGVAFANLPDAGRVFVVALRDVYEVHGFVPEQFSAFAWTAYAPIYQPFIVLSAEDNEVVVHELAHVISHGAIHHQPHWFAEGLAGFFETVHLDADSTEVDVGEPSPIMVRSLRFEHLTRGPALFACEQLGCMDHGYYTTAWALFSYLIDVHPQELARLEQLFDEESPDRAWHDAFPELDPASLDAVLRDWLQHGKHRVWHFKVALRDWPVKERTLGDGDVYAVRALLKTRFAPSGAPPPPELAAALAADPTNVLARLLVEQVSAADAQATAAAHPDDWRAWWLVVQAAPSDDARAKLCELVAQNPAVVPPRDLCRARR